MNSNNINKFLIKSMQDFYQEFNHVPGQRAFLNYLKQYKTAELNKLNLNLEDINSIWLLSHFPDEPIKKIAKLAGINSDDLCI